MLIYFFFYFFFYIFFVNFILLFFLFIIYLYKKQRSFGWIFANILTWKSEIDLFDIFFHGKFENQNAAKKALMDFITNKQKIKAFIEKKAKYGNNDTIMSVILGCLTVNPDKRPTFLEIVDVFNEKIFLEAAFQNSESGKAFWKKYFVDQVIIFFESILFYFINLKLFYCFIFLFFYFFILFFYFLFCFIFLFITFFYFFIYFIFFKKNREELDMKWVVKNFWMQLLMTI